jgi:hypothetical protein
MRLYRLCECEGRLDFGAYAALKNDVTIAEALELEAALCVIGDHRAEFAEFYQDDKKREHRGEAVEVRSLAGPTPAQMREELAYRQGCLERARGLLTAHRRAVGMAASGLPEPPGRIDPGTVTALEAAAASHAEVVSYLTEKLGSDIETR